APRNGWLRLTPAEREASAVAAKRRGRAKFETCADWNNPMYARFPARAVALPAQSTYRPGGEYEAVDFCRRLETATKFGDLSRFTTGDAAVFTGRGGVAHAWPTSRGDHTLRSRRKQRTISRSFNEINNLMREPAGGHNYGNKKLRLGGSDKPSS